VQIPPWAGLTATAAAAQLTFGLSQLLPRDALLAWGMHGLVMTALRRPRRCGHSILVIFISPYNGSKRRRKIT